MDATPIKITEEDLNEFGDAAMPHVTEFLVGLAIRAKVILEKEGGLVLSGSMKHEAIDYFAALSLERFEEFEGQAMTLFREMTQARVVLCQPKSADLWPMVAFVGYHLFVTRGQLPRRGLLP